MDRSIPNHVAIIMDGNRRWAKSRRLPTAEGHRRGVEALVEIVEAADKYGVKYLSVYALSTENYKNRPGEEIQGLLTLFKEGASKHVPRLKKNGVKVNFLGNINRLPKATQFVLGRVKADLEGGKRGILNIAINYGGREEIIQAAAKLAKSGAIFDEKNFEKYLFTKRIPDPELVIRTGGHKRISNFLLWQSSYSELYFTKVLWPDFDEKEFKKALDEYTKRVRNFGR